MNLRTVLIVISVIVVVGLVFLLNALKVNPGLAMAAYAVVAVSIGATLGYFADRLPEPSLRRGARAASQLLRHDH